SGDARPLGGRGAVAGRTRQPHPGRGSGWRVAWGRHLSIDVAPWGTVDDRCARCFMVGRRLATLGVVMVLISGLGAAPSPAAAATLPYQDPTLPVATRVADLLARMSLDDKLGQMTRAERTTASPADVTNYRLGSILSGGGSAPSPNTPTAWADMIHRFQDAALATPLGIPLLYGTDAVHGHNNVVGATIFPHNIGLGATRDPDLVRRIGRATAEEMVGTGALWNFAPCLCVARNDRWGRTYESFGETPELP